MAWQPDGRARRGDRVKLFSSPLEGSVASPSCRSSAAAGWKGFTIGFLGANSAAGQREWMAAFVTRLGELGWVEGSNRVAIERTAAEARSRAGAGRRTVAAEGRHHCHPRYPRRAGRQAGNSIRIVFGWWRRSGWQPSRLKKSRPVPVVSNVTSGPRSREPFELVGKRVELLREMVLGLASLGLLMNAATPARRA